MLNKVKHAGREKSVSCDSGSWFAAVIIFTSVAVSVSLSLSLWLSLNVPNVLSLSLSPLIQRQLVLLADITAAVGCSCNSNMFAGYSPLSRDGSTCSG